MLIMTDGFILQVPLQMTVVILEHLHLVSDMGTISVLERPYTTSVTVDTHWKVLNPDDVRHLESGLGACLNVLRS